MRALLSINNLLLQLPAAFIQDTMNSLCQLQHWHLHPLSSLVLPLWLFCRRWKQDMQVKNRFYFSRQLLMSLPPLTQSWKLAWRWAEVLDHICCHSSCCVLLYSLTVSGVLFFIRASNANFCISILTLSSGHSIREFCDDRAVKNIDLFWFPTEC